jgi:hypothetical protein
MQYLYDICYWIIITYKVNSLIHVFQIFVIFQMENVEGKQLGCDGFPPQWRDRGHIHRRPRGRSVYRTGKKNSPIDQNT